MSEADFAEWMEPRERLAILEALDGAYRNQANSRPLVSILDFARIRLSHDRARMHLAWLAEGGFVSIEEMADGSTTATLTDRGFDAVK